MFDKTAMQQRFQLFMDEQTSMGHDIETVNAVVLDYVLRTAADELRKRSPGSYRTQQDAYWSAVQGNITAMLTRAIWGESKAVHEALYIKLYSIVTDFVGTVRRGMR